MHYEFNFDWAKAGVAIVESQFTESWNDLTSWDSNLYSPDATKPAGGTTKVRGNRFAPEEADYPASGGGPIASYDIGGTLNSFTFTYDLELDTTLAKQGGIIGWLFNSADPTNDNVAIELSDSSNASSATVLTVASKTNGTPTTHATDTSADVAQVYGVNVILTYNGTTITYTVTGDLTASGSFAYSEPLDTIAFQAHRTTGQAIAQGSVGEVYALYNTPEVGPLFLDTYDGAAFAYSTHRRLNSSYTGPLIRVRRSSDNTSIDIGYTAGDVIDEAAITAFVGANNGFVQTLYDQSGSGKDSVPGIGKEATIVESGTIYKNNGFVSMKMTTATMDLGYPTNVIPAGNSTGLVVVDLTQPGTNDALRILSSFPGSGAVGDEYLLDVVVASGNLLRFYDAGANPTIAGVTLAQSLVYANLAGTTASVAINGGTAATATTSATAPDNDIHIGEDSAGSSNNNWPTSFTEVIFYLSDESANRAAMEAAINSFYSIY